MNGKDGAHDMENGYAEILELAGEVVCIFKKLKKEFEELGALKGRLAARAFNNRTGLTVDECMEISGDVVEGIEKHSMVVSAGDAGSAKKIASKMSPHMKNLKEIAGFFHDAAKDADIWITDEDELARALETLDRREKTICQLIGKMGRIC